MVMSGKTIMGLFAHADDVEFAIGGTLLKYTEKGYGVDYILSTNNMSGQLHQVEGDGSITRIECVPEDMEPIRKREAAAGAADLGCVPLHLDYPQRHYSDQNGKKISIGYDVPAPKMMGGRDLPNIMIAHECREEVAKVAKLILERDPEVVLTHSFCSDSPEHYATALLTAKGYAEAVKRGYGGELFFVVEVCESSFFLRNHLFWDTFIDITGRRQAQFDLIRNHLSMVPFPERMDYLDFTPHCGIKDAELFNWFRLGSRKEPANRGMLSEELLANFVPGRWRDF